MELEHNVTVAGQGRFVERDLGALRIVVEPGRHHRGGTPGPVAAAAEPIDLLGVTGVRAATGRLLRYLLVFLLGGLVGGALVALLVR